MSIRVPSFTTTDFQSNIFKFGIGCPDDKSREALKRRFNQIPKASWIVGRYELDHLFDIRFGGQSFCYGVGVSYSIFHETRHTTFTTTRQR